MTWGQATFDGITADASVSIKGSQLGQKEIMENKRSWWSLKIHDYPNYDPNDADLDAYCRAN